MPSRPRLLVSVRDEYEADLALHFGADIIDLKEPHRGALGRTDWDTMAAVDRLIDGRRPLSVALGELTELSGCEVESRLPAVPFAKLGLAGAIALPDWPAAWREIIGHFPSGTEPVAVAYADFASCNSPDPDSILRVGGDLGCAVLLVDTFDKNGGNLFRYLPPMRLRELGAQAQSAGMQFAVAGSLTTADIETVLELNADILAIRGAACRHAREGAIDGPSIHAFKQAMCSFAAKTADHSN